MNESKSAMSVELHLKVITCIRVERQQVDRQQVVTCDEKYLSKGRNVA